MSGLPRCEADGVSEYWGGCHAPSRYRIERSLGTGYWPAEACPAHVADVLAAMADGEDVPLIVRVHFDDVDPPPAPVHREEGKAEEREDGYRWLTIHGIRVFAGPGCVDCRQRGYYMGGGGGPLSCPYCGPGGRGKRP